MTSPNLPFPRLPGPFFPRLGFRKGGAPSVQYGRAISFVTATGQVIPAASSYLDYTNWTSFEDAQVTPLMSDGSAAGITVTPGAKNSSSQQTKATDGGYPDFDILAYGRGFSNTTPTNVSVSGIPFAKYDVFVGLQEFAAYSGDESGLNSGIKVSLGGQDTYFQRDNAGYLATAAPLPFRKSARFVTDGDYSDDYAVFRDLTAASFDLDGVNAGIQPAFTGPTFIQIRERLDGLTTLPQPMAQGIIAVGDSYTQGSGGGKNPYPTRIQRYLTDTYSIYPASIDNRGVGGSTMADQYAGQVDTLSLSGLILWWDGEANGYTAGGATEVDQVNAYMGYIANMVSQKGDDNFVLVMPIPTPSLYDAGTVSFIAAFKAAMQSTYAAKNLYDPTALLVGYGGDSDTSIGGLPASIFVDSHHLNDAPELSVAEAVAEHILVNGMLA